MSDLLTEYRTELLNELLEIYIKSVILKEFLYIFPFMTKISFNEDHFITFICKKIFNKYFQYIKDFIVNEEEFDKLCKKVLSTLITNIQGNNVINFVKDFPNFAFSLYNTEDDNILNITDEYDSKYKSSNMYREYYIKVEDSLINEAITPLEIGFLNRINQFRGILNIKNFKYLINTWKDILSEDRFFKLIKYIYIGVRLVYNSSIFDTSSANIRNLYESILSNEKYRLEKTNALKFIKNDEIFSYKFPLIIAKQENLLNLNSYSKCIEYIDSDNMLSDIYVLSNNLWEDPNFYKLFKYHVPIQTFQNILFSNFSNKYYLLKEIMEKNSIFQELDGSLIKLMTRIKYAEDPIKI